MAEDVDLAEAIEETGEDVLEMHQDDLMRLFDEMSFTEKWKRVIEGLKQPPDTGAYKWAKLQMVRLISPAMAVVVPIIMLGLITLFASLTPEPVRTVKVKVVEPEPIEELEEIEEPIFEPEEPPDPVEVDFTPDSTMPPSEVAAPPVDYSVQPAEFDSVAMVRSPVIMRGIIGSRNPGSQGAALNRFGGAGSDVAVLRALRWFARNQHEGGSWGGTRPAMTALVLLAYLAHGDTPASEEFGYTVEKAIRFLVESQQADGHFRGKDGHDYTQPICAYALSEAYAMTKVPQLKEAAIKAIYPVVKGQNAHGGFNYNLKGPTDQRNDLSYIAWCVQALKAAKMAGLYGEVDGLEEAMKKAVAGVKKNYGKRGEGYGGFSYSGPGASGLTGAGILSLQFLGEAKCVEVRSALATTDQATFGWDKEHIDAMHKNDPLYYFYYLTQAKFQEGGATWDGWNKQFKKPLMENQDVVGKEASGYVDHRGKPQEIGSWGPVPGTKVHGGNQDGVFSTVLCTLMLEVYYRYLPTFMQVPEEEIKEELGDDDDLQIDIVDRGTLRHKRTRKQLARVQDEECLEIDLS